MLVKVVAAAPARMLNGSKTGFFTCMPERQ